MLLSTASVDTTESVFRFCFNTAGTGYPADHTTPRKYTVSLAHSPVKKENNSTTREMNDDKKIKSYRMVLNAFMSFRDGVLYTNTHLFSDDALLETTPEQLVKYFCLKVYGVAEPTPEMRPTQGRSNSILFAKKAISYFMPNKLETWSIRAKSGNPTRSVLVNNLVKAIKKMEVRRQGAPSQARRALLAAEYESIIRILRNSTDPTHKYLCPAFHMFQFNLIARVDDTAHLKKENIRTHPEFPFALLTRMCWSKNVHEERDAPDQIVFGAMNPLYCCLLSLGIHFETWFSSPQGSTPTNDFVFGIGGEDDVKGPSGTRATIYSILTKFVFLQEDFRAVTAGHIGTHSFRKFPATLARKKGCSRDDVDSRGRWRNKVRVSDVYMDIDLPHNDARTASRLCVGGAIKYEVLEETGVSRAWLTENVNPLTKEMLSDDVAGTLGATLLWAAFDDDWESFMPAYMRDGIRNRFFASSPMWDAQQNPVKRVLLSIHENEGELFIQTIQMNEQGMVLGALVQGQGGNVLETVAAIQHHVAAIQREQFEIKAELELFRKEERVSNRVFALALQRLSRQPGRILGRARVLQEQELVPVGVVVQDDELADGLHGPPATLGKNPKTLHSLWREFEEGLGGRKPAKMFTARERGKVKQMYYRRKVVWDSVALLIRAGYTAQTAIDRIYETYGADQSVTNVIKAMLHDRQQGGGHPNLRVGRLRN